MFAALVLGGGAGVAEAQPLPDNDYAIDLYQGPVLAPLQVIGIAGAYVGYAEGLEGMSANAGAAALREPYSKNPTELDATASLSVPIELFENNDFDNNGEVDYDYSNSVYLTAGGRLQIDEFGAGLLADVRRYSVTDAFARRSAITLGTYHLLTGLSVLDGQLVFGGGARAVSLGIDAPEANLTLLGFGPEIGVVIRPNEERFRFGVSYRAPVSGFEVFGDDLDPSEDGVDRIGGLVLPRRVVQPWELALGAVVQFGARPLNPRFLWPGPAEARAKAEAAREATRQGLSGEAYEDALDEAVERSKARRRARYENFPRQKILLATELLITGAVERGVSVEQFVGQNQTTAPAESVVGSSGGDVVFSPRVGLETEPLPERVLTRFGTYFEPVRFTRPIGRQHFTFGADIYLFETDFFDLLPLEKYELRVSADLAPRYESVSFGFGVWK